jgi:hypothetical protein
VLLDALRESDLAVLVTARVDEPVWVDERKAAQCIAVCPKQEVRVEAASLKEADPLSATSVPEEVDRVPLQLGFVLQEELPQPLNESTLAVIKRCRSDLSRQIFEPTDFAPEIYPPEEQAREEAVRARMAQNACS